jgi:hypothetical protein
MAEKPFSLRGRVLCLREAEYANPSEAVNDKYKDKVNQAVNPSLLCSFVVLVKR